MRQIIQTHPLQEHFYCQMFSQEHHLNFLSVPVFSQPIW